LHIGAIARRRGLPLPDESSSATQWKSPHPRWARFRWHSRWKSPQPPSRWFRWLSMKSGA